MIKHISLFSNPIPRIVDLHSHLGVDSAPYLSGASDTNSLKGITSSHVSIMHKDPSSSQVLSYPGSAASMGSIPTTTPTGSAYPVA